MFTVLIVDDEQLIVQGLEEMLKELPGWELDVHAAYSAFEAIEWMNRTRIDLVITDIRMPKMNGIELQKRINARWPRCKIIFLTGHTDFDYIQFAMRHGSEDYILKTESGEEIIRSVERTLRKISNEQINEQFFENDGMRMDQLFPLLQRQFLLDYIVEGGGGGVAVGQDVLDELRIPLRADERVLPVAGRVDWPSDRLSFSEKSKAILSMVRIAAQYFGSLAWQSVEWKSGRFLWLIQPKPQLQLQPGAVGVAAEAAGSTAETAGSTAKAAGSTAKAAGSTVEAQEQPAEPSEEQPEAAKWETCVLFVQGTLELIHRTCKQMLGLPVSFASAQAAVPWPELANAYDSLNKLLHRGLGHGKEMLLLNHGHDAAHAEAAYHALQPTVQRQMKRMEELEAALGEGDRAEFVRIFGEIADPVRLLPTQHPLFIEMYFTIVSLYMSCMNRWNIVQPAASPAIALERLYHLQHHPTAEAALRYLADVADVIMERKSTEMTERTDRMIARINAFVREHLHEDLSLTRLGELVYLNPTYLSNLYKQTTGVMLSEFIAEARIHKAKKLLKEDGLKIHEISTGVGFENAGYFTRFFKKRTGLTPQEYRDSFNA